MAIPHLNSTCAECKRCDIPDSCDVIFRYENSNAVLDDNYQIAIIKKDGSLYVVGTIKGTCGGGIIAGGEPFEGTPVDAPAGNCECGSVDTSELPLTLTADMMTINLCTDPPVCGFRYTSTMTQNNGCGTFGVFTIVGPYGTSSGNIASNGTVDLEGCCF